MTGALDKRTRTQRAELSQKAPSTERRDAPALKVAWVVAGFVGLMLLGLVAAALVVWPIAPAHEGSAEDVGAYPAAPPGPPLLAEPSAARARIEGAAQAHLHDGPLPIEQAMAAVVKEGWQDNGATPRPAQAARAHVGAR